jgi:DNA-binding transcriptional regulator PaaX
VYVRVILVQQTPKSAQILAYIAKRDLVRHSNIIVEPSLVTAFSVSVTTTPARRITDTVALLARQGYVSVGNVDGQKVYTITLKGRQKLIRAQTVGQVVNPIRWDGRYYFITFDIPERQKVARNQIILDLKNAGFINYSKGLWLSPYNPTKYVEATRKRYNLSQNIRLIVASHLEDEPKIKRHFKL